MNSTNNKTNVHKCERILKLAVISDMHAWDKENSKDVGSWLVMGMPEDMPNVHPIAGLLEFCNLF